MQLCLFCFVFGFFAFCLRQDVNGCKMFSQENEQLRSSLMQAHTDVSVLHAELDRLKNLYMDQKELHER